MTPHIATNPHEEAARLRKAYALADCAQAHELPLDLLEQAGPEFWATCAEQAGCNPPSDKTIGLVISIVRERVAASGSPTHEQRPAPSASTAERPAASQAEGRPAAAPTESEVWDELDASYRGDDDPFEGLPASPSPWRGLG